MNAIYRAAKNHLGEHLTLDPSVPLEEGCAEAVSTILRDAGYPVPRQGIAGVNALIEWMLGNGFQEVASAAAGCVITAHSPNMNDANYAHCGIVLKFGIASNNSFGGVAGRFTENYNLDSWLRFFGYLHGSKTRYFTTNN